MRRSEEQLEAERESDDGAQNDDHERRGAAEGEADLVGGVHPEMAQAGAEVQQIGPDQGECDQFPDPIRGWTELARLRLSSGCCAERPVTCSMQAMESPLGRRGAGRQKGPRTGPQLQRGGDHGRHSLVRGTVPRRRGHNRYRQIYDQELSGRPLVAEGLPCGSCGFPMLSQPVDGQVGRWVHADCTAPPEFNEVAVHLVVHWAQESGEAAESLLERVSDQDLNSAVKELLSRWRGPTLGGYSVARTSRPRPSRALRQRPRHRLPHHRRCRTGPGDCRPESKRAKRLRVPSPSTVQNEATLADTCISLRAVWRRRHRAGRGSRCGRRPGPIAEAIAELLEGLAKTVIQQARVRRWSGEGGSVPGRS